MNQPNALNRVVSPISLKGALEKKERAKLPVRVAVVGAGWFGGGLIRELYRWPGMEVSLIIEKCPAKVLEMYRKMGIPRSGFTVARTAGELTRALDENKTVISGSLDMLENLAGIDVVFDATGDILTGAQAALYAFRQARHFVTISAEMDATIGPILNNMAKEHGVIYSNSDGDQPGVLTRMIDEIRLLGFDIVVAGNGKGFLNYHAVPEDIMQWVRNGQCPRKITSFTDGTKQAFELAVLANATGLVPDKRGMHGPKVTKETLIRCFLAVISREGIVDYVMGEGINLGMTVFVVAKRNGDSVATDLEYLKMGKGPHYLFFRDYHLCYFEAPRSIADVALFSQATIAPQAHAADVIAVAKRDLASGERLDGIGGYTVYGLIDRSDVVRGEGLLPLGLAEYAVMKHSLPKDTPLTYDMVEFPQDNLVLRLRREQENSSRVNELASSRVRELKKEPEQPVKPACPERTQRVEGSNPKNHFRTREPEEPAEPANQTITLPRRQAGNDQNHNKQYSSSERSESRSTNVESREVKHSSRQVYPERNRRARTIKEESTSPCHSGLDPESKKQKILVLGAGGMLGSDIVKTFSADYEVTARDIELDITKKEPLMKEIKRLSPDIVINCAAYTDVDGCENNPNLAFLVNAEALSTIAASCRRSGAKLVHYSTDYIFDGTKREPYLEHDLPNPINVYGKSKLKGEHYIQEMLDDYLIIRTAWLFGAGGRNFVSAILELARERDELTVINDRTGSPTYTVDLARATADLVLKDARGIFNVTARGACSWFALAQSALRIAHVHGVRVTPIGSSELHQHAVRPENSVLNCEKFRKFTECTMPAWRSALRRYVGEMNVAQPHSSRVNEFASSRVENS